MEDTNVVDNNKTTEDKPSEVDKNTSNTFKIKYNPIAAQLLGNSFVSNKQASDPFKAQYDEEQKRKELEDKVNKQAQELSDVKTNFIALLGNVEADKAFKIVEQNSKNVHTQKIELAKELIRRAYGRTDKVEKALEKLKGDPFDPQTAFNTYYQSSINILRKKSGSGNLLAKNKNSLSLTDLEDIRKRLYNSDTKADALKQAKEYGLLN